MCKRVHAQYFKILVYLNTVAKHMTNDVCFVDLMEAAILKILLVRRRFSHFYDTEKRLLRNKWSSRVFKQHNLINQFDLLRKICFVCAYKAEPNSNQSQNFISYDQEERRTKKQYRNQTLSKDTYLYRQLLPIIMIVSWFSGEKCLRSRKMASWTFVVVITLRFAE